MQLLRGRTIGVDWLTVSPDSRHVAAGGAWTCHVWDLSAPKLKAWALFEGKGGDGVARVAFPTPTTLLAVQEKRLRRYDLAAATRTDFSTLRVSDFFSAILHPSGDSLKSMTLGGRRVVSVTVTAEGLETVESERVSSAPGLLGFDPDGTRYLARDSYPADPQRRYHLRDSATDEVVATFEEQPEYWQFVEGHPLRPWAFTPDGRRALVVTNRHVVAYDCATGGLPVAEYHTTGAEQVNALAIAPDGRRVATVEGHRTVTLRDAETFAPLRSYDFAMRKVNCVAFTPDGTRCVIGNSRGKVLLFDVE